MFDYISCDAPEAIYVSSPQVAKFYGRVLMDVLPKHFSDQQMNEINGYITRHIDTLPHLKDQYFIFIDDVTLRERLAEEFYAARYIYKFLQGMQVKDHLLKGQVRIQILQYASIYEACIHHILFVNLAKSKRVINLQKNLKHTPVELPGDIRQKIEKWQIRNEDNNSLVTMYKGEGKEELSRIRFESKVKVAKTMKIISAKTSEVLIDLYNSRNAIHIHAELRKGLKYELELAEKAFRISKSFREEVISFIKKRGGTDFNLPPL